MTIRPSRDVSLQISQSALISIGVQNFCARRDGGDYRGLDQAAFKATYGWQFNELEARTIKGYCRQVTTDQPLTELTPLSSA